MKLYTDEGNFQSLKLYVAAAINNVNLEVKQVPHDEKLVGYLSTHKLPVLELKQGTLIFSTNAAARLLMSLSEKDANEAAVDHWLEWESACLLPAVFPHLALYVGHGKTDDSLIQDIKFFLSHLDTELKNKETLCGEKLTTADVCLCSTLYPVLAEKTAIKGWENEYSSVQKWFGFVTKQDGFQKGVQALLQGGNISRLKASLLAQPAPLRVKETGPRVAVQKQASKVKEEPQTEKIYATPEEVTSATEAWNNREGKFTSPFTRVHPILPLPGQRNILITSALPYVNNVPHLGNIIGCVLSADVFSRFCRLRGCNCVYICGTDEYGTATETKAIEEGLTPQEVCDKYSAIHRQIYEWFNIDFDHFGRTTTEQQTRIAQDIFWQLHNRDLILHDSMEQLQCMKCDRFLADRFVEGVCPFCGYEDARGDQCDACGKLINAVELRNPKCKLCKSSPEVKSTNHLFLDLPKIEPELQKHLDRVFADGTWTSNAKVITQSWIRDGLKPRCISRDLKWGTPVPLEGYTDKVFYVWFDAPIGYISITANYTDKWEQWWKNPEQVEMYNFLGKDNVPFHSVIFPATLLGTEGSYTVVNHMSATEYLNYEDGKFSKSRSSGVFGDQAKDTGITADVFRFYLLYVRPESQDSNFSWDDLLLKCNTELLNNLGNFINRALTFVKNSFGGVIQEMTLNDDDLNFLALINRELQAYVENMEAVKLRDSVRNILSISRLGNQIMQENKPWVLAKGNDAERLRAGTIVSLAANISCLLSALLQPYMPEISASLQSQLNAPAGCNRIYAQFFCHLPPGHVIGTPSPLFQKIEPNIISDLKKKFAGKQASAAAKSKPKPQKKTEEVASPEDVGRLTEEVTKQGERVRDLKASKAEKALITEEVGKLLELKKQLAAAKGEEPEPAGGGKKKSNKKAATQSKVTPVANEVTSTETSEEVKRLTSLVAEQGNKVRELKANKADKAAVSGEVARLLELKEKLALAQGHDPTAVIGQGKKKGKK